MSTSPSTPLTVPFEPTTTPTIERANRLMSLIDNPGFRDLIRLSQELVDAAVETCSSYPGWDTQQMVVLKVRMQAAKEHHLMLLNRIREVIGEGVAEARASINSLPAKTAEQAVAQGDYVRRQVLQKFDEMDMRPAGSYSPEER